MKHAFCITACVFLGSAITVLVAWGCGTFGAPDAAASRTSTYPAALDWPLPAPDGWPAPTTRNSMLGRGLGLDHAASHAVVRTRRVTHNMTLIDYGWPMYAMRVRSASMSTGGNVFPVWSGLMREGLTPPRLLNGGPESFNRLALEPLWPGFAVNAAAYGGPIWLAALALLALRRGIRRRRGCCTRCAYELAGLDACPECGLVVPGNTPDGSPPTLRP